MPTVIEILKQTGLTDEQIAALGDKVTGAFGSVLTASEQKEQAAIKAAHDAEAARVAAKTAQDATELERRSLNEFYDTKVMPGLVGSEEKIKELEAMRINAESKATFYETQIKGLKDAGFLPADAPAFVVPTPANNGNNGNRDGQGRFVAGPNGSPQFIDPNALTAKIGDAYNTINDILYEHQVLFGKPSPLSPSQLIAQADALKLSPAAYAERQFNFTAKRSELAEAQKRAHDAEVAATASAARDAEHKTEMEKMRSQFEDEKKKLAERMTGNNPEIRSATQSKISEVQRAVNAGERKDPLKMTDAQRRVETRNAIHKEIAEREVAVA